MYLLFCMRAVSAAWTRRPGVRPPYGSCCRIPIALSERPLIRLALLGTFSPKGRRLCRNPGKLASVPPGGSLGGGLGSGRPTGMRLHGPGDPAPTGAAARAGRPGPYGGGGAGRETRRPGVRPPYGGAAARAGRYGGLGSGRPTGARAMRGRTGRNYRMTPDWLDSAKAVDPIMMSFIIAQLRSSSSISDLRAK